MAIGYPDLGQKVLEVLEAVNVEVLQHETRLALSIQLRELLTRHRQFPEADWVLEDDILARLQALYDRVAPPDPVEKQGWLFESWPDLPEKYAETHEEHASRLQEKRLALVQEVYTAEGLDGIRRLSAAVERPDEVGSVFGLVEADDDNIHELLIEGLLLDAAKQAIPVEKQVAWGMVWRRVNQHGLNWAKVYGEHHQEVLTAQGLASLLLPLQSEGAVWDIAEAWGKEVAGLYWERVNIRYASEAERDLSRAVEQLIQVKRPYCAIDIIGMSIRKAKRKDGKEVFDLPLAPDMVSSLLQQAPLSTPDNEWHPTNATMVGYTVSDLLPWLEKSGVAEEDLARIEWLWLQALDNKRRGPMVLHRTLSTDPELFINLLSLVYKAEGDDPNELTDEELARSQQASRLLQKWSIVPGTQLTETEGGEDEQAIVDEEKLIAWINSARTKAEAVGRLGICDDQIGSILASAPGGEEETWPCEAVRNAIEQIESDELENGMHIAILNQRGAHFRTPGGDQERELAEKYEALRDKIIDRWPRTGKMLDAVRQSYERQAKWHDDRDSLDEFSSH